MSRTILRIAFLAFLATRLAAAQAEDSTLVLAGATVHDGSGGEALRDAAIVVARGRIVAVGPRDEVAIPDGARVVDVSGLHAIPGLVDTHVHYSQTGWVDGRPDAYDVRDEFPYAETVAALRDHPERIHLAFLYAGVTAVFDAGGFPWTRRLPAATETSDRAPHVVAAGPLLGTYDPPALRLPDQRQIVPVASADEVREAVRSHAALGSQAIKFWFIVRGDDQARELAPLVRAAGDEASKVGLPLVVHATTLESARIAVEAGARLLVHSVEDRPVDDAFVRAVVERGVSYCPTLVVHEGYVHVATGRIPPELEAELGQVDPWLVERIRHGLPVRTNPGLLERGRRRRETMAANLRRLSEAGAAVVLGTDAGNPFTFHGPSVFREAEAMAAAGLSPRAVLRSATRDAARAIGRGEDLGLIEAGRIADLVLLEHDPTEDVRNFRSIRWVVRAGSLHRREDLRPR